MAKRRQQTLSTVPTQLQSELQATGQALREAYEKFNYVSEPELVEASVYEISALKARYSYLLRQVKESDAAPTAYVAAGAMKGGRTCQS